jgi:hypothetical protein
MIMKLISKYIKWVMLVSGVLTCTMIYAAFDPQAALLSTFGASISGPLAEVIVRNWGVLVFLIGAMLIYGAYNPVHRTFVIIIASISKVVFISLVVTIGDQYLSNAGAAIAFDSVIVVFFLLYLLGGQPKMDTSSIKR